MRGTVILLVLTALPAHAQNPQDPTQPRQAECRLDAKADDGTGITCTGIQWPPPSIKRDNPPPAGVVNIKPILKHPSAPDVKELVRAKNYKGPEPIGVERKRDRFERAVPKFAPHQIADKKFWLLAVVIPVGSSLFDLESAQYGIRRGGPEFNPVLGQRRPQQYGVKLALNTSNALLLYIYKKWDMQDAYMGNKTGAPKWWHMALAWPIANFAAGIHNFVAASGKPLVR